MTGDPYALDRRRVRRAFDRAAPGYDEVAVLQAEVRRRLLERLDLVNIEPRAILDLGCGTGQAAGALARRHRRARVLAMDLAEGMAREARRQRPWLGRLEAVCGDAMALPLADAGLDLVFSSLMLQWCDDPDGVFADVHRVLAPGGLFLFSTFGPDTLKELRTAWGAADGFTHVSRFIDMHDLGDALVRVGMAEPVMDVEHFTLTYADPRDLMRDLKAMGARNATAGRGRGLTTPRRLAAVEANYEALRRDGRLPATWEVVYGHAWATGSRPAVQGEFAVPIERIGRRR